MSEIAAEARRLAASLLPRERASRPPRLADVEQALAALNQLSPVDAHDEAALHEAGETLLRLRDAAGEYERAR